MTDDRVRIVETQTLHRKFLHLSKVTAQYVNLAGHIQTIEREIHDHGNAATIFLYDPARKVTVLVRQLRLAAFLNGDDGWLIETPAGLLDGDEPEAAITREVMEETGYRVENIRHLFDAYMSPGSVTEKVSFFAAEIDLALKHGNGGGVVSEGEDIEVLEIELEDALAMVAGGEIIDGKTIMLLQWAELNYLKTRP